jgi:enamine deaminase RidA (YjgF/YER057c/UK114 family)
MDRRNISSGTDWDPVSGCAQIVRLGSQIYVAGTTGINGRGQLVAHDAYAQAVQALRNIELALQQVGADRTHVIRTRMYVSSMNLADAVSRAHSDFFSKAQPTTTIVEAPILGTDTLVEIEAEAVLT